MTCRDLLRVMYKVGSVLETDYNYGSTDPITPDLYKKAENFKISGYGQIYTIDGLKRALVNNGPCLIAVPVYNNGKHIWIQGIEEQSQGGHAMAIVGYTEHGFIIRNSSHVVT